MICQFYFDYFYITSSKRQSQRLISLELFVNEKNLDEADVLAKIVGSVHSGVRNLSILPRRIAIKPELCRAGRVQIWSLCKRPKLLIRRICALPTLIPSIKTDTCGVQTETKTDPSFSH